MLHQELRARAQKIEQDAKRMRVLEEAVRWLSQYPSGNYPYSNLSVSVDFNYASGCSGADEAKSLVEEFIMSRWIETQTAALQSARSELADLCESYGVAEAESDAS